MKRLLTIVCSLGLAAAIACSAWAQGGGRGKSTVTVGSAQISVEYGKPALRGRTIQDMLGQLPAGGFWRLGANKSTTFSTTADLDFGGTTVPKGEYSLWAQKQADNSWKLVFNSQHGQWGTDHDPSKDLVSVPLTQEKAPTSAEQVTINLAQEGSGGKITIQWGDLQLSTTFTAK
jgi:Protein of unknown function (DUF2911)